MAESGYAPDPMNLMQLALPEGREYEPAFSAAPRPKECFL